MAEDTQAREEQTRDDADPGAEDSGTSYPGADESDRDEIEAERERRLAPENRPANTEIDNTGENAPDLSRVDPAVDEDAPDDSGSDDGDDGDDEGGRADPSEAFEDIEVSDEERREIEEERERRLAPENRPPNTEIDNSGDNEPDLSRVDPEVDDEE